MLLALLLLLGTSAGLGLAASDSPGLAASDSPGLAASDSSGGEWLSVHFFDVDQGDSTLIFGDGYTILIDAGRHDRSEVVDHLRRAGVEAIDLFVLTHPHADHIGQCPAVMRNFAVEEVWMSGSMHTTLTFERCLDAVLESDAGYHEPRAGEAYDVGPVRVEVVHPRRLTGDLNNDSIGVRIVYGNVAILLTGDAEREAEAEMLARGHFLASQVMKLGHHGSRTSSTAAFIAAVNPAVAVYSAGQGNTYGHPHAETLRTLAEAGVAVYGTDVNGTVVVRTDGAHWHVEPERGAAVEPERGAAAGSERGVAVEPERGAAVRPERSSDGGGTDAYAAAPAEDPREPERAAGCGPGQVDINFASESELTRIVHVGPVTATRIAEARPFDSVEDLLRVSGIGRVRLADIVAQGLVCVGL